MTDSVNYWLGEELRKAELRGRAMGMQEAAGLAIERSREMEAMIDLPSGKSMIAKHYFEALHGFARDLKAMVPPASKPNLSTPGEGE